MKTGFVALVGWTSAGKSTLLNQWVGEEVAITSPKQQTTRGVIRGILNLAPGAPVLEGLSGPVADAAQVVFLDTPGFHVSHNELSRRMLQAAREALSSADLVLYLKDASLGFRKDDERLIHEVLNTAPGALALLNKVDKVKDKTELLPMMQKLTDAGFQAVIPVCARNGNGTDAALREVVKRLPEGAALFPPDLTTDQPERYLIGEFIRESVVFHTREEVPHGAGVVIEAYEDEETLVKVKAALLVERDGHRPILLGKGGSMIKAIGTRARLRLEERLGVRFHLELFVRVEQDWRNRPDLIAETGA